MYKTLFYVYMENVDNARRLLTRLRGSKLQWTNAFHPFILIAWLADGDSLMCYIVTMGRLIAQMFSRFSLWGCLFIMVYNNMKSEYSCYVFLINKAPFDEALRVPHLTRHCNDDLLTRSASHCKKEKYSKGCLSLSMSNTTQ